MSTPATPTSVTHPTPTSDTTHLIHPLTFQDRERIDILYGGTESEVLKESVALTRDIMTHSLKADEGILYVNTLISDKSFEAYGRRATKNIAQNRRFHSITLLHHRLAQRLEFLKKTIEEKNIRYVILNGFEFASMSSRHRIEIFFWLKSLRDEHAASVIIFTQSGPRRYGTLGQMRFVSASCEEVGAYIRAEEEKQAAEAAAEAKAEAEALAAEEKAKADAEERAEREASDRAAEQRKAKYAEDDARRAEITRQWQKQKEESWMRGQAEAAARG